MTHEQYEVLSNQAVAACAVVYFLAVLAHLAQWAARPQGRGAGRARPWRVGARRLPATPPAGAASTDAGRRVRADGSCSAGSGSR